MSKTNLPSDKAQSEHKKADEGVDMSNERFAVPKLDKGVSALISPSAQIHESVEINVSDGGSLEIGERVSIMRGTTIYVFPGAKMKIGDNTKIGENTFLAAMCAIYIGQGCGISNMVDIHDHNHCNRDEGLLAGEEEVTVDASGFEAAPIIIESGVVISNKVTITAGARIGQNSKVGANSVVSRSLPNNSVCLGTPAKPIKHFRGPALATEPRREIHVGIFGDSILEHMEASVGPLYKPGELPDLGTELKVDEWVKRGFVHQLELLCQSKWGHTDFHFHNNALGGSTSRDILLHVQEALRDENSRFDLVFLNCGTNDVWRRFQGRNDEAVSIQEFERNYSQLLEVLRARAREVVCFSSTPVRLPDLEGMNAELATYNGIVESSARKAGCLFVDAWEAFDKEDRALRTGTSVNPERSLWVDGVHLSELGDSLMRETVWSLLEGANVVNNLMTLKRYPSEEAVEVYSDLISKLWLFSGR